MELVPQAISVVTSAADRTPAVAAARYAGGSGAYEAGPLVVTVSETSAPGGAGTGWEWSVANRGDAPVRVRSVSIELGVAGAVGPLRMFRHGYQSWSPSGVATLGVDVDPSTIADLEFLQGAYHADQRRAAAGELRSEWVTVLADGSGAAPVLAGFDGGDRHDGTFRLGGPAAASVPAVPPTLRAEAFLGDAVIAPGEHRALHSVGLDTAAGDDAAAKLARWADAVGQGHGARTAAPYQVGWCSWYQYFHDVTESAFRANLALAADWPFDVFQLDDGYQAAIGDWLRTNDKFPSTLDRLAADVAAAGRRPGIWLAPFLVAPDSQVARDHPDWLVRYAPRGTDEGALRAWWNPPWGGGDQGFMNALDTTNPDVADHIASVAGALVEAGFTYLKLDFTFAPSIDGGYRDPSLTPAERVRAGYEAVRRGAGDDTFLLGCGVPLANVVGVVDGNRIGQDVHPVWSLKPGDETVAGYLDIEPATLHAYTSTVARAFQHRRLWLNDPDCLMLRTSDTSLSAEAARTWAHTVAVSGGMALVSDDLALLDTDARSLLDEVVALGRECDAAAAEGRGPVCPDLLDHEVPHRLSGPSASIEVDVATGSSTLSR